MHAVFIEVNITREQAERARPGLQVLDMPRLRTLGAVSAVFLAPEDDRAVGVVVFEEERMARRAARALRVGSQAGPSPTITFRTVQVREVLGHL